jgi:tRNA(Ile)-lysidine synthase
VIRRKISSLSAHAKLSNLAENLNRSLRRDGSLAPGERIAVAVSGGADSVALLHLLLEIREDAGIILSVAHFNHKLRGRASDADEKFVRTLAAEHGLEFFVAHEEIAARAKRERGNLEEVARKARYAFFEKLVREERVAKIAVAHTADDQAETVMAHILRGTGLAGLGGIHPQAGAVFRPLLSVRREDLRKYLRANRRRWREDSTNLDTKRTRARIRQKLMPLLAKNFQPMVVEHLCRLAELAREDEAYLEAQVSEWRKSLARESQHEVRVALDELLAGPKALRTRLLRQIVQSIKPRGGQLSAIHVAAVLELAAQKDSGKALHLPGGVEVRRDRDSMRFRATELASAGQAQQKSQRRQYSHEIDLRSGSAQLPLVQLSCRLSFRVIDWPVEGRETSETGAVLDRDRLRLPLVVRNWRPGDAMRPVGHQNRHKLARLLNEKSVSRWEKESWPVLTSGGELAWVRDLPVSAELAAGAKTRRAVLITEEPAS